MPKMSDPNELFAHELADVLYVETLLTKTLPKLAREATDSELREAFEEHLAETRGHVKNVKQAFRAIGEPASGERCPGMDGITSEHDEFMAKEQPSPAICDVFLTGAAARTEHYEIAAYTGLVTAARALGQREAARLLNENLKQEKTALRRMERISRRLANEAKTPTPART